MMKPKANTANTAKMAKRLLSYIISRYKATFAAVLFCIFVSAGATVASSLFLKTLVDGYITPLLTTGSTDFSGLLRSILTVGVIYLCGVLGTLLYNQLMVKVSQGTLKSIRDEMFAHMQKLPIRYFDTHTHGDIMSYYTNGGVGRQTVAAAPGGHRAADVPEAAGFALHIARLPGIETAALDGVAGVVAEDADALVQHGQVRLVGLVPVQLAAAALPRLAVHQDIPPAGQGIQSGTGRVHGVHVVQAHQVEPETVDVVLLRPVEQRVDHIFAGHGALAGKLVAAAAAVGQAAVLILAEKVVRYGVVQHVFVAVHVVIHHIHDHADACRVQGGDHLFALPHPHFAPGGVGGVAALREIVVGGVVAPVVLPQQRLCLVHAAKVENGHQLHIAGCPVART